VYKTKTKIELANLVSQKKQEGHTIGFVPTMGALHNGHASLINIALTKHTYVVVSIFVNPTQFNNAHDLKKYPRTLEKDTQFLERYKNKVIIYAPSPAEVYGKDICATSYNFGGIESVMEGEHRAGHFDGVGTVLNLLFRQVTPEAAFFGEKDFQQLQIVKKLVEIENLPLTIEACPIHRQKDGLAMSSRNSRLTSEQLQAAPFIYASLKNVQKQFSTRSARELKKIMTQAYAQNKVLNLEYFEIANVKNLKPLSRKRNNQQYRAFVAVFAGEIRLIDNIALNY
jgi:pantoate--beta-alanine ligase